MTKLRVLVLCFSYFADNSTAVAAIRHSRIVRLSQTVELEVAADSIISFVNFYALQYPQVRVLPYT
jgi:hypothetical protein